MGNRILTQAVQRILPCDRRDLRDRTDTKVSRRSRGKRRRSRGKKPRFESASYEGSGKFTREPFSVFFRVIGGICEIYRIPKFLAEAAENADEAAERNADSKAQVMKIRETT